MPYTLASLDGTTDEADWLTAGHTLDTHEVQWLRTLLIVGDPAGRELPDLADALERAERAENAVDGDSDEDADRELTDALREALGEALAILRRDGYVIPPTLGG